MINLADNNLPRPVVLAGLTTQRDDLTYALDELAALAQANNLEPVATFTQKLERPNSATYFGKGKVEELSDALRTYDVDLLVVNDELSPSQIRNLESALEVTVVDRTGLILDIFAQRAESKVAKLQVQLAQLHYQLPRLRTSMAIRLDQQGGAGGGGFTSRGAGETKLETSRRTIEAQMTHIRAELKTLQASDDTRSKQRRENDLPTVALVGYTNAGKSTIMNRLLARFGVQTDDGSKQVFEKDMLFATLNTTVRQLTLPDKSKFLLSDTVGFVSQLPHDLVEAFKSTLQEAANADLLLHVVDIADPHYKDMMATTEQTLKEIGVTNIPMLTIYNKADRAGLAFPDTNGDNLTISALDEASQDMLIARIQAHLFAHLQTVDLLLPYTAGDILAQIKANYAPEQEDYQDEGIAVRVALEPADVQRYAAFIQ
ncbi:MAG TPA: GTPase HflX [Lactobacillaceae bacterium]|jgi:GTP-binding protein HflX